MKKINPRTQILRKCKNCGDKHRTTNRRTPYYCRECKAYKDALIKPKIVKIEATPQMIRVFEKKSLFQRIKDWLSEDDLYEKEEANQS